jgi:hypothetical protein
MPVDFPDMCSCSYLPAISDKSGASHAGERGSANDQMIVQHQTKRAAQCCECASGGNVVGAGGVIARWVVVNEEQASGSISQSTLDKVAII